MSNKNEPRIRETPEMASVDLSKPITMPGGVLHAPRDSYMLPPAKVVERAENGLPIRWEEQQIDATFIDPEGNSWPAYLIGEFASCCKILVDPGDLGGRFKLAYRFHAKLICEYTRGDPKTGKSYISRHEVLAIPHGTPLAIRNPRKAQYKANHGKSVMTHCWTTVDGLMPAVAVMPNGKLGTNSYTDGSFKEVVFGKPLNKAQLKTIFHDVYVVPEEEKPKPKLRIAGGTAQ
jgi:hypothetical protein